MQILIQPICSTIVEKVKIEALKGKIFNFNENNQNHKVYPSACGHIVSQIVNANLPNILTISVFRVIPKLNLIISVMDIVYWINSLIREETIKS